MSESIGEFVRDGEPVIASNVNGTVDAESGDSGTQRTPERVINGYESFAPGGPATERILDGRNTSGEPKRTKSGKLDRRTKAGRSASETSDSVSYSAPKKLVSLETAILSLHDMAAGIFQIPELCLSEAEAKTLNDAVLDVSKYYVSSFDPKKVAIFNLATCMGGIYATRVMAYRHRVGMEKRNKLKVMTPTNVPQNAAPPQGMTIEQYLGGNPPAEGAAGF